MLSPALRCKSSPEVKAIALLQGPGFTLRSGLFNGKSNAQRVPEQPSIQVVRAFVKLREVIAAHKELAAKFHLLESKFDKHDKEIQALPVPLLMAFST